MDGFSNSTGAGVVLTGAGGDSRPLQVKIIQLRITKVGNLHIFRSQQFDVEKSVEAFLLGLRDAVRVDIPEASFEEGGLRRFGQVDGRNTLPSLFGVERGESCVSEPRIELRAPKSGIIDATPGRVCGDGRIRQLAFTSEVSQCGDRHRARRRLRAGQRLGFELRAHAPAGKSRSSMRTLTAS